MAEVLSDQKRDALLLTISKRFKKHMHRHEAIDWPSIQEILVNNPRYLSSVYEMEKTGGEPDILFTGNGFKEIAFIDCSVETPTGRRNTCYDRQAWASRKENKPENNAIDMAVDMGIELLTEDQYRHLQQLGEFDLKTSSWLKTPGDIRQAGGAIFGDRRYGHVFVYHNGAQSYYSVRGFRGILTIK